VSMQIGFSPWQKSFHDYIIRTKADYQRISQYIDENPQKWTEDCYYNIPQTKETKQMPELLDLYDKNGNRTGRLVERGKPIKEDEYVLGAHVWIINSKQEFLLTKRSKGHCKVKMKS